MRTLGWLVLLCVLACSLVQAQEDRRGSNSDDDTVLVPAGTQVTVQFSYPVHAEPQSYDVKVVWPVRLGFYTAVPVGSPATLVVFTRYYDYGAVDIARLTSVTVEDETYRVQSDELEISAGYAGEMRFTLIADLKIKRK